VRADLPSPPGRRSPARRLTGAAVLVALALAAAQIVLAAPPAPDFTVSPLTPQPGESVTFASTVPDPAITVEWDFENDGSFDATGDTAQHAYAGSGEMTVRMRATDTAGESAETTRTVRVNAPPVASFSVGPAIPVVGAPVTFDGSSSSDDGAIAAYDWDLDGDGAFGDASGATVDYMFSAAGERTVRLQVTDSEGVTATETKTLRVNAPPIASFGFSPGVPQVGSQVTFDGSSSSDDGAIAAYEWDLDGDGEFDDAAGPTAQHAFDSAGEKTVRLRVTDADGVTATEAKTLRVGAPPTASFDFSPAVPEIGAAVTFDGSA
jgi:PKD repeat protein